MRKAAFALLSLAIILGGLAFLRAPVLEGKMLGALRPYYVLLFPPEDLYQPIVRFAFDPNDEKTIHSFSFSHRYFGAYSAGIYVEKAFDYHEKKPWISRLDLRCTGGGASLVSSNLGAEPSPFLGSRGNGFQLVHYQVPGNLPQGLETKCQLRVVNGGSELPALFGKTDFYVQKQSDL
jgi:hypothetical protein